MPRYEPPRGGNRGGKDLFEWEDIKIDKHRENYLGHSVKAPTGRWQKGKDLTWYTKESKVTGKMDKIKAEIAAIKRAEEEAMAAALGLKPPAPVKPQQVLTKQEIAEVCRRRSVEEMDDSEERMKGVGFQSRRAQLMFSGTESTTTKEGATVFEHDPAQSKGDDRLKLGKVGRTTAQRPAATPSVSSLPEVDEEERAVSKSDSISTEKKGKKKKSKREKKSKKKKKVRERHDSDSSSEEEHEKWIVKHHDSDVDKPSKSKKRRHDSGSDGSSDRRPHRRGRHDSDSPSDKRTGRKGRHDLDSEGPSDRRRGRRGGHDSESPKRTRKRTIETSHSGGHDHRRHDYNSDKRYEERSRRHEDQSRGRDSSTHKKRRHDTLTGSD